MNYRNYLLEDVMPFWVNHSLDREEGGIITCLDKTGNVKDTTKNVWFVGRSLWSFSLAYRLADPKPEYLDACEVLYSFLDKCTRPDGTLPFTCDRDGGNEHYRHLYYSEAFAAIGCAQYYRICHKEEVWQRAEKFFDICYGFYKNPETKVPFPGDTIPYSCFGIEMIMLNLAQFMRNAANAEGKADPKYDALAKETIYNMINGGHISDEEKVVREYLPITDTQLKPPQLDYTCPGHVYEAAWFVLCEGEVQDDDDIRALGLKLLDYALPEGFEKEISLVVTGINDPDLNNYIWWPQCEAIVAYHLGYNISKNEKYLKIAKQLEEFSFAHFADHENGEWYTEVDKDGNVVNSDKGTILKGPFHLPRMLFGMMSLTENGDILTYMS